MTDEVAKPTAAALADTAKRQMIRALMGGTAAMRAAGKTYLPQEVAESQLAYDARLARSFLFNGLGKTVRDLAGKVFSKPIVLGDDVPEAIKADCENIDLAGRNLDTFAHAVFTDALQEGVSFILTDMTAAPETGRPVTMAETAGRRPWLVHVKREQVLGWRKEVRDGKDVLTQFRFIEEFMAPDGPYGEKPVKQVRVFNRVGDAVTWETWRSRTEVKSGTTSWVLEESGIVTIGEIAVAPVYTNRTGFFTGSPPLADLAEVNVAHWQSQSDQRNILHVARVPILFGAGIDAEQKVEIGAGRMFRAANADASLTYVEHSGAAIGAGRDDLKDLEFQMQTMGLELLIPKPGGQTATGEALDAARMNSTLAMMAMALGDALEMSLGFMARFRGLGEDAGGSVTVNTDFGVTASAQDVSSLTAALNAKAITRATYLSELKRRGILSADVDPEEEVQAAMNEGYEDPLHDGQGDPAAGADARAVQSGADAPL